jgi:hypothetical protein
VCLLLIGMIPERWTNECIRQWLMRCSYMLTSQVQLMEKNKQVSEWSSQSPSSHVKLGKGCHQSWSLIPHHIWTRYIMLVVTYLCWASSQNKDKSSEDPSMRYEWVSNGSHTFNKPSHIQPQASAVTTTLLFCVGFLQCVVERLNPTFCGLHFHWFIK